MSDETLLSARGHSLSLGAMQPHVEVDVQAGKGEPSLGEEGEQCRVDLVRVGPRDVVRSAVQGDHPDVLDETWQPLAIALTGRIRSSVPWITRVGTSNLRRSGRKSVSQVSTQACVAYADAPSGAMKPACQAWSLMRLPPRTSAL